MSVCQNALKLHDRHCGIMNFAGVIPPDRAQGKKERMHKNRRGRAKRQIWAEWEGWQGCLSGGWRKKLMKWKNIRPPKIKITSSQVGKFCWWLVQNNARTTYTCHNVQIKIERFWFYLMCEDSRLCSCFNLTLVNKLVGLPNSRSRISLSMRIIRNLWGLVRVQKNSGGGPRPR